MHRSLWIKCFCCQNHGAATVTGRTVHTICSVNISSRYCRGVSSKIHLCCRWQNGPILARNCRSGWRVPDFLSLLRMCCDSCGLCRSWYCLCCSGILDFIDLDVVRAAMIKLTIVQGRPWWWRQACCAQTGVVVTADTLSFLMRWNMETVTFWSLLCQNMKSPAASLCVDDM